MATSIYDSDQKTLDKLLELAGVRDDATLLIPDLQRPYVWNPVQVIRLVDSLLRGWPFGTLLFWDIGIDESLKNLGRPFWAVVDRTTEGNSAKQAAKQLPPATYTMVLDGQQRLQSLVLAFGNDEAGFKLSDREWVIALSTGRVPVRRGYEHWSSGQLAIDLDKFEKEFEAAGKNIRKVEFERVLAWVVMDPTNGMSQVKRPQNYKLPLVDATAVPGQFLRLSRVWRATPSAARPSFNDLGRITREVLTSNGVNAAKIDALLDPIAELVSTLHDLKQTKVGFLRLAKYEQGVFDDVGSYNDAIVNIFTRLNSGGRALTRQEITFAWIKTGWQSADPDATPTTASDRFEKLRKELGDTRIPLEIDELVNLVSTLWSVVDNKGALLTSGDLLRGDRIRPMASDLKRRWTQYALALQEGAAAVQNRGLEYNRHYRSLNAIAVLCAWRMLGRLWLAEHPQAPSGTFNFEHAFDQQFGPAADRWILSGSWANLWARSTDETLQALVKSLADLRETLKTTTDAKAALDALTEWMKAQLLDVTAGAEKAIDVIDVDDRSDVKNYHTALWLWHRLAIDNRWEFSQVTLQTGKTMRRREVDHVVAFSLWDKQIKPNGWKSDDDPVDVNSLGNMMLLEKTFNIEKSAATLESFMGKIDVFKTQVDRSAWMKALALTDAMVDPITVLNTHAGDRTAAWKALAAEIVVRDATIRKEIKNYLRGTLERADLDP